MEKRSKKLGIAVGAVAACGLLVFGGYQLMYEDMTGKSYSEIEAYMTEHPKVKVTYSVTIDGGNEPLMLKKSSTAVSLESDAQIEALLEQAEYLQNLEQIDFGTLPVSVDTLEGIHTAFPDAKLSYTRISVFGQELSTDVTELDWSHITSDQMDDAIKALDLFPDVTYINLIDANGNSKLTLDDALRFKEYNPEFTLDFAFDLFGQHVTTDMERLEYFKVHIGDEGLVEIRKILPMMYNLNYLKLDWCDTTDEAMAQLRDDFPEIKVVWRVFFSVFNCLTDTYKIWAVHGLMDKQIGPLKYCTEVRYLDLGHNYFTDLDFMNYMPHLKVAIVAIGQLKDIEGIRNCKELEFLEIFSNPFIDDLSPLEGLTNLEYLNISNMPIKDLSPLDNMTKLKKLNSTMNFIPQEEIDHFKELHPDCDSTFLTTGDPTDYGWRYINTPNGRVKSERYALLTKQIGYEKDDVSQYPKGYLTEEINSVD